MSSAIKANNFADLRAHLKDAPDDVVKATEAYWAALPGVIAAGHRRVIREAIERRETNAAFEALVSSTRWEATR